MASDDASFRSPGHFAPWRRAYEAVLKESDTKALFKLVEVAEAAVRTRLADLRGSSDHHSERLAISEALANLRFVKRERLNFRQEGPTKSEEWLWRCVTKQRAVLVCINSGHPETVIETQSFAERNHDQSRRKCSICGDILLSRPIASSKPIEMESMRIAGEFLDRVFRTHRWDEHGISDEAPAIHS